jgi:hypothetical protein
LLWLFLEIVFLNISSGWPRTVIVLISASQIARITGVLHQCLAEEDYFLIDFKTVKVLYKINI